MYDISKYGQSNRWMALVEEVCASVRDFVNGDLAPERVESACVEVEAQMLQMPQPYMNLALHACEMARLVVAKWDLGPGA